MPRDHWSTGEIEAIATRWKAMEQLRDAAAKFLAHVVALGARDGDGRDGLIYLDDIPEVLMMKAALRAIDESERGA